MFHVGSYPVCQFSFSPFSVHGKIYLVPFAVHFLALCISSPIIFPVVLGSLLSYHLYPYLSVSSDVPVFSSSLLVCCYIFLYFLPQLMVLISGFLFILICLNLFFILMNFSF